MNFCCSDPRFRRVGQEPPLCLKKRGPFKEIPLFLRTARWSQGGHDVAAKARSTARAQHIDRINALHILKNTICIMEEATMDSNLYSFDVTPEDTVPLLRLSLRKLRDFDAEESQRFFEASKELGFFYLDLQGVDDGQAMLDDVDALFGVGEKLFQEDLSGYDFSGEGSYFGQVIH